MARKKRYEEYFKDMTDEEMQSKKEMRDRFKSEDYESFIEIFKIDGNKKQIILLMEPYHRDIVIDASEEEIIDLMRKYYFFKVDVKDGIALFAQDLFNESPLNQTLRQRFKKDFGKYYQDILNKR
jgi:hypothetical protein